MIEMSFDIIAGSSVLEWNFDLTLRGLHWSEFLILPLGGLHV
jgi:hypothetical protein